MEPRWLTDEELTAWLRLIALAELLPSRLDAQLRRDSALTHFEYQVLAMLSEAPERTLRMSWLARRTNATLPRLSHVVRRLEERGLVNVRHGDGTYIAELTGRAMSPAMLALYARHGEAFYDYLEYRREQEAFATRLAAQRATAADKERLAAIRDDLDARVRGLLTELTTERV